MGDLHVVDAALAGERRHADPGDAEPGQAVVDGDVAGGWRAVRDVARLDVLEEAAPLVVVDEQDARAGTAATP